MRALYLLYLPRLLSTSTSTAHLVVLVLFAVICWLIFPLPPRRGPFLPTSVFPGPTICMRHFSSKLLLNCPG